MRRHCLRAIIIQLKWPFTRYFEILHHMFTYCIHVCRLTFEYTVMYIQCILTFLLNIIQRVLVHNVRINNRALYNRICTQQLHVHTDAHTEKIHSCKFFFFGMCSGRDCKILCGFAFSWLVFSTKKVRFLRDFNIQQDSIK